MLTPDGRRAVKKLISNALKHAFPAARRGWIRVGLEKLGGGDQLSRVVADDGADIPDHVAIEQTPGLRLVTLLAKQLGATMLTRQMGPAEASWLI